jgi:DNA-binding response OmpR family regulator
MVKRLTIVDGDSSTVALLASGFERRQFAVDALDLRDGTLDLLRRRPPDLMLLTLSPARASEGLAVCQALASGSHRVPVIVLAPDGCHDDGLRGLRLGADDCVTGPIVLEELVARVHAVLRRTRPAVEAVWLGPTLIDFRWLRVVSGTHVPRLTDREFEILRCLADHAGAVVSRDELFRLVWGYTEAPLTRTVDGCVFRLRRKLEPDPHHPIYLRKAYGDGYRLVASELRRAPAAEI